MTATGHIALRGVRVHNLKSLDLDLPHGKLIVFCGLSGSGKSSLALDTLYAEGQRRYIESFSAYTRQFLQRLEKPEAERIDGIPPAIAVTGKNTGRSSRSTVGTATETNDYLRLLMAKIGEVFCLKCGRPVRRDSPQSAGEALATLPAGTRYMIAFGCQLPDGGIEQLAAGLREDGFVRAVIGGRLVNLDSSGQQPAAVSEEDSPYKPGTSASGSTSAGESSYTSSIGQRSRGVKGEERRDAEADVPSAAKRRRVVYPVVDRLVVGSAADSRLRDSLETAFTKGRGRCCAFVEEERDESKSEIRNPKSQIPNPSSLIPHPLSLIHIDGRPWRRIGFSTQLACEDCGIEYPPPEPRLYSFNSPLGACPVCEGFGNVIGIDMELVVPDPGKSLREGAIAPWNTPAYAHELKELLALARDYELPVDVPFRELGERHRELLLHGVPERKFGGLEGFFAWLERRKYKMHVRVFLSRWRSYRPCPACGGARLRPEALAARIGGKNLGEISALKVRDAAAFFRKLSGAACWRRRPACPRRRDACTTSAIRPPTAPRPDDARTGAGPAGVSRSRGAGLSDARPHAADPQRRRGPPRGPHRRARLQPGEHALRARRAVDRPAPPRHPPTPGRHPPTPRPRQHHRRGRARGGRHPRRRSGGRDRSRRRRARRQARLSGHAGGNRAIPRQPHRRLPVRPPRPRLGRQPPPLARARLDPPGRRGATTSRTSPSSSPWAFCVW